jgi:hypothetical protein
MHDFQLDLAEGNPFRTLGIMLRYAVVVASGLLCLCPRPGNVELLEVHVRALSTQPARIGLHAKHGVFSTHSTRDVYQNVLARLQQVEPLAMDVLQVGIADGRSPGACTARVGR